MRYKEAGILSLDGGHKSKGFPKNVLRINLCNILSAIQLAGVTISYKADCVPLPECRERNERGCALLFITLLKNYYFCGVMLFEN